MSSSESTDTLNPQNSTAPAAAAQAEAKAAPAPDAAAPKPAENDALATAKKEASDNHDRYLRAVADLENFRRRSVREKEDLRLFATSKVLEDLLPVIDNLGFALSAAQQPGAEVKNLAHGVEMVLTKLKSSLADHGLKEINPAGQVFDANLHESISAQPSADVAEGKVMAVVRTGYSLNGRLLRPASVVVSSGSPKEGK